MSGIQRVSTLQMTTMLQQGVSRTNSELAKTTQEMTTGLVSDLFAQNPAGAATALTMRGNLDKNEVYQSSNSALSYKLQVMADVLGEVSDSVSEIGNLALGGTTNGSRDTLQASAKAALELIVAQINQGYGGEQLFAGQATDTVPLVLDPVTQEVIYQGAAALQVAKIDDQTSMTYGISAGGEPFQSIFTALTKIATTDTSAMSSADYTTFTASVGAELQQAGVQLVDVTGALGAKQKQLSDTIDAQESLHATYNTALNAIERVDEETTAIKLQSLQTQLQTNYEVTASISKLSLLNYL